VNVHKKTVTAGELKMYRVLDKVADHLNERFDVLLLPKPYAIQQVSRTVEMPRFDGEKFNNLWSVSTGGSQFGNSTLVEESALVLRDFCRVETSEIDTLCRKEGVQNHRFDFDRWRPSFGPTLQSLVNRKLLPDHEASRMEQLVDRPPRSDVIMSNADFYPRNFIRVGDRVAVIDWDPWENTQRLSILDHRDCVIAFLFVHMWGNREWQARFLKECRKLFDIDVREFQRAVIIKAIEQSAHFQRTNSPSAERSQVRLAREAVSISVILALLDQ
jgi:hypothetical protein